MGFISSEEEWLHYLDKRAERALFLLVVSSLQLDG